jgi:hypothetical protein
MSGRLTPLQAKRDILNAKIKQELARPSPCSLRLQALKRQRLRIKDRMAEFSRTIQNFASLPARS